MSVSVPTPALYNRMAVVPILASGFLSVSTGICTALRKMQRLCVDAVLAGSRK